MLRESFKNYLNKFYPNSSITIEHSIGGKISLRFELGDNFNNGTLERVENSVSKAKTLVNEAFDRTNKIWFLCYDYLGIDLFGEASEYLYKLFPNNIFSNFYHSKEIVTTRFFETNELGESIPEKTDALITIGLIEFNQINFDSIFRGIANREMGFEPNISQSVFFFDYQSDKGFHMYDDRGCYIWSNTPNEIKDLFVKRKDWLVEDYEKLTSKYFK